MQARQTTGNHGTKLKWYVLRIPLKEVFLLRLHKNSKVQSCLQVHKIFVLGQLFIADPNFGSVWS
jgi:hypothetical protein